MTEAMTALGDGVYLLPGYGNAGLVLGGGEALLVDTRLLPEAAAELAGRVAAIAGGAPRLLVNTHFHGDHTLGNAAFAAATTIAHEATGRHIERYGAAHYRYLEGFFGRPLGGPPLPPRVTFRERLGIHLGPRRVEALHLGPGHTPGDAVVVCRDAGVVFCGDLLTWGVFPYTEDALCDAWIDALGLLVRLDAAVFVPGHGPAVGRDAVAAFRDGLAELRAGVAAALREGGAVDEAAAAAAVAVAASAATAGASLFRDWTLREEWLPHAVKRIYRELKVKLKEASSSAASPGTAPPALLELAKGGGDA